LPTQGQPAFDTRTAVLLPVQLLVGKGSVNGGSIDVDFIDDALYASSYRRPYCQLEISLYCSQIGFDLGLTSSYPRAG
jgi:hypothetical protein